eukprot:GHVQ01012087.1.p1 GENE.GHVQ01012087.1~~GHVQ01012087.1.p1  ORF type:complete len:2376 (+),score=368.02 GHVQ01012087.1:781-7908(+)
MAHHSMPSRTLPGWITLALLISQQIVSVAAQFRPSPVQDDADDGFGFLLQETSGIASRRLGMSEDSIGEVVLTNTYVMGEGGTGANVSCATGHCNTTAIIAGGSFYVKLEDRDETNNFTAADAISFEEVSMGGCSSSRSNAVGKTGAGSAILTKFSSVNSTLSDMETGLPRTEPIELDTPGKVSCHVKTTGSDLNSCYAGCDGDDCGDTANRDNTGIAVSRSGFYNLCVCLDGDNGAECSNGNKEDFDVDLGVLVQVNGFSQASLTVDDVCDAVIQKCIYGYTCKLSFEVSGYTGGSSVALTDVNTGIGSRYDTSDGSGSIDASDLVGKDAIAIMNMSMPCTEAGSIMSGVTSDMIATAAYKEFTGTFSGGADPYHPNGERDDLFELADWHGQLDVVEFDFAASGAVAATPGEYRACYCPGGVYGSEESGGLSCTAGHPEYFPFKAGKVAIRGPYDNTLGATTCHIGTNCTVTLGSDNVKCHHANDTIAIVGDGSDASFSCGAAGKAIQGLTTSAKLNGLELSNPVNGSADGAFTFDLKAGSATQGVYNLCWCPKDHEACFAAGATSSEFKVKVGNVTIPGAIASNPKSCYAGRECTIKFASSEANTDCYGCQAGDTITVLQQEPKGYAGSNDADGLTFHTTAPTDLATCGSSNTTRVTYSSSSLSSLAKSDSDSSARYNYTFSAVDLSPPLDSSSSVHQLCWSSVDLPETVSTLVTLSNAISIYGSHPDNYVTCSANGTDCTNVALGVKRHASLATNSGEDVIIAQSPAETCGAGTTVYMNTTEASDLYQITNQQTVIAPTAPGVYKMCYCPTAVMDDSGLTETSTAISCESASEYKTDAGMFVVGGPSKALATGSSDGSGLYKVFYGSPFELEVVGYELGVSHKMKIINTTERCDSSSFNTYFDTYLADGSSPTYVSSAAVLAGTSVVSASRNTSLLVDIEIADTDSIVAGDVLKFTSSYGATQGVNRHTREKGTLFRTHQADNAAPRDDWTYDVVRVVNATHIQIAYPGFPVDVGVLGVHVFQLSNKESYPQLIASRVDSYKLCWAGTGTDYFEAGTLSVVNPTAMPSANLYVTTHEVSKAGPAVIAFTTGSSATVSHLKVADGTESVKSVYEDVTRSLTLRIRFPDTTKFKPLKATYGGSSSLTSDTGYDSEAEGEQKYCTKMFFEMSSPTAMGGFPVPEKCWYQTNSGATTVDMYVQFSKGNGLAANTEYQLVMNTMFTSSAGSVQGSDADVEVWVMDDSEVHRNTAIEYKSAVFVSNGYNITANNEGVGRDLSTTAIKFTSDNATSNILDVTETGNKTFKIVITGGASKPQVGDEIHITLHPLTSWDLQPTDVSLNSLTGISQTSNATISTTSVIPGGNNNVLVIQMADNMTATHTIHIDAAALSYPTDGMFPTVPAYTAELVTDGSKATGKVDAGAVDFSSSVFLYKKPVIKGAHLVTRGDDGVNNVNYFKGDSNVLYAKVVLGAPLFFNGASGDTRIVVTLPSKSSDWSYSCNADTVVAPDTLDVVRYSNNLWNVARKAPTGNGQLSGSWTASANVCTLKMDSGVMVPANAALYFKLSVSNPTKPVKASDPDNVWSVDVYQGKGPYSPSVSAQVISANMTAHPTQPGYGPNVPVVGKVPQSSATVSFLVSSKVSQANKVGVFFQTEQSSAPLGLAHKGGMIELVAPDGYAFGSTDGLMLSPGSVESAEPSNKDCLLPSISAVHVGKKAFNSTTNDLISIVLSQSAQLDASSFYGFTVPVINSATAPGTAGKWMVSTFEGPCLYGIEGIADRNVCAMVDSIDTTTQVGLTLIKGDLDSEPRLHKHAIGYFGVHLLNNKYTGAATKALVKFQLPDELNDAETVTLQMPEGYSFSSSALSTNLTAHMNVNASSAHFFDANRNAVTWTASSVVANANKLTFTDAVSRFNQSTSDNAYYLEASVTVPADTPSFMSPPSANAIYMYTGETKTDNGTAGAVIWPGMYVRKIGNALVEAETTVNGTLNTVRFGLQTFTAIKEGGCLRISFPYANMKFSEAPGGCFAELMPDQFYNVATMPHTPKCTVNTNNATGTVYVESMDLEVTNNTELSAGRYRFALDVVNPVGPYTSSSSDMFTFESYSNCSASSSEPTNILDKMATAEAFSIKRGLKGAYLMTSPGNMTTTNKPGVTSAYTIGFEFSEGMTLGSDIVIVAPAGYIIASDCTDDVDFTPAGGPNSVNATVFNLHEALGSNATLVSCTVTDTDKPNEATVVMSAYDNLQANVKYVLSINVTNPLAQPKPNKWTLTAAEQSKAFPGAMLRFFKSPSVVPSTPALSDNATLSFYVTPMSRISGIGSSLTFKLPPGLQSSAGHVCKEASVQMGDEVYTVSSAPPAADLEKARNITTFGAGQFDCM